MPRSNWNFIASVVGCLIVACALWALLRPSEPRLPGYQQTEQQDSTYRPGGSRCEPLALARLSGTEALKERESCKEAAEEHRLKGNDLIQQTRAADAAAEGVALNYQQTVLLLAGTIIGFFTLVAAIFAALFAKAAADHTKLANAVAFRDRRDGNEAVITYTIGAVLATNACEVRAILRNVGKTRATNIQIKCKMIVYRDGKKYATSLDSFSTHQVLAPGDQPETIVHQYDPTATNTWVDGAVLSVRCDITFQMSYTTEFHERVHVRYLFKRSFDFVEQPDTRYYVVFGEYPPDADEPPVVEWREQIV